MGDVTRGPVARGSLAAKALLRLVAGFVIVLALLLLPAGTVAYWEAWAYVAVVFVPMTSVVIYLIRYDPELLERRMRTRETSAEQSRIVKIGAVCYVLAFVLPGFDRRFEWSRVSVAAVVAADVLVLLGYGLFILVLRKNTCASRVVEVEQGQRVVTTGPYAIVRHPMYLGILVMILSTPVALGSWWAVLSALPLVPILVARIRNEEQLLAHELSGYQEYVKATRYRLIPRLW